MSAQCFDRLARGTAPAISRRGAALTLGGASLAALASSPHAEAKRKKRKRRKGNARKCRKKARKRSRAACQRQVGVCEDSFVEVGAPEGALCCALLATCDFAAFFTCGNSP